MSTTVEQNERTPSSNKNTNKEDDTLAPEDNAEEGKGDKIMFENNTDEGKCIDTISENPKEDDIENAWILKNSVDENPKDEDIKNEWILENNAEEVKEKEISYETNVEGDQEEEIIKKINIKFTTEEQNERTPSCDKNTNKEDDTVAPEDNAEEGRGDKIMFENNTDEGKCIDTISENPKEDDIENEWILKNSADENPKDDDIKNEWILENNAEEVKEKEISYETNFEGDQEEEIISAEDTVEVENNKSITSENNHEVEKDISVTTEKSNKTLQIDSRHLYIANFPTTWTHVEIKKFIQEIDEHKKLKDVTFFVILIKPQGTKTGEFLVKFPSNDECEIAFKMLQGIKCENKELIVAVDQGNVKAKQLKSKGSLDEPSVCQPEDIEPQRDNNHDEVSVDGNGNAKQLKSKDSLDKPAVCQPEDVEPQRDNNNDEVSVDGNGKAKQLKSIDSLDKPAVCQPEDMEPQRDNNHDEVSVDGNGNAKQLKSKDSLDKPAVCQPEDIEPQRDNNNDEVSVDGNGKAKQLKSKDSLDKPAVCQPEDMEPQRDNNHDEVSVDDPSDTNCVNLSSESEDAHELSDTTSDVESTFEFKHIYMAGFPHHWDSYKIKTFIIEKDNIHDKIRNPNFFNVLMMNDPVTKKHLCEVLLKFNSVEDCEFAFKHLKVFKYKNKYLDVQPDVGNVKIKECLRNHGIPDTSLQKASVSGMASSTPAKPANADTSPNIEILPDSCHIYISFFPADWTHQNVRKYISKHVPKLCDKSYFVIFIKLLDTMGPTGEVLLMFRTVAECHAAYKLFRKLLYKKLTMKLDIGDIVAKALQKGKGFLRKPVTIKAGELSLDGETSQDQLNESGFEVDEWMDTSTVRTCIVEEEPCRYLFMSGFPRFITPVAIKNYLYSFNAKMKSIFFFVIPIKSRETKKNVGDVLCQFNYPYDCQMAYKYLKNLKYQNYPIKVAYDKGNCMGKKLKANSGYLDDRIDESTSSAKVQTLKRTRDESIGSEPSVDEAKKAKTAVENKPKVFFKKYFMPPAQLTNDIYGLSPSYLESLGLAPPLTSKINVSNLAKEVTAEKLREVFSLAGMVTNVYVISKKKAKITFDHPVEAVQAVAMFNNQMLYDMQMVVIMDPYNNARLLPEGLISVGQGLGFKGEPLRGVRAIVQMQPIKKALEEMGKIENTETHNQSGAFANPVMYANPVDQPTADQNAYNAMNTVNTNTVNMNQQNVRAGLNAPLTANDYMLQAMGTDQTNSLQHVIPGMGHAPQAAGHNVQNLGLGNVALPPTIVPQFPAAQIPQYSAAQIPQFPAAQIPQFSAALTPKYEPQINLPPANVTPLNSSVNLSAAVYNHNGSNFQNPPGQQGWSTLDNPQGPGGAPYSSGPSTQHQSRFSSEPGYYQKQTSSDAKRRDYPKAETPRASSSTQHQSRLSPEPGHYQRQTSSDAKRRDYPKEVEPIHSRDLQREAKKDSDMLIFINLPYSVTAQVLNMKMREVGELMFGELTGEGRAIVRFKDPRDAARCIKLFHRSKVDGQVIEVKFL